MVAPLEDNRAEAEELFTATRQRGCIPLPQLTDVDLCVFSNTFRTLLEENVWRRWFSLTDDEQDTLATQARGFLEHRHLLRPIEPVQPGSPVEYHIQPKLGFILAARERPSFLAVCSVPGQLRVGDLRLFGIQDEEHPDPVVVLERGTARGLGTFGRIREYALATSGSAAGVVADWVRESIETDVGAVGAPRLLEIYRHRAEEPLTGERLSVVTADGGFSLTHTKGESLVSSGQVVDQRTLAEIVAPLLRTDPA